MTTKKLSIIYTSFNKLSQNNKKFFDLLFEYGKLESWDQNGQ